MYIAYVEFNMVTYTDFKRVLWDRTCDLIITSEWKILDLFITYLTKIH